MRGLGFERHGLRLLGGGRTGVGENGDNAIVDELARLGGGYVGTILIVFDDQLNFFAEHAAFFIDDLGAELDAARHRFGVEFTAADAIGDDADLDNVLGRSGLNQWE